MFVNLIYYFFFLIVEINCIDLYRSQIIRGDRSYSSYEFNVVEHLSGISPYFESNVNELNPNPPEGCQIVKAVYLIRHGSVYVDDYDYYHVIRPFLNRLLNISNLVHFSNWNDLSFLSNWSSPISNDQQIEKLTKSGILEAFEFGTRLSYRYPHLLPKEKNSSFQMWTSSSNRTEESAFALYHGLFGEKEKIGRIISIKEDQNLGANSLTPTKTCPQFKSSRGSKESLSWLKHYSIPIRKRFNQKSSSFHFSANDILAMQQLCGYETVIRGSSPFCTIFTVEEWIYFEYYFDIKYYYELAYGNNLSPFLGMPWIMATTNLLNNSTSRNQNLYISVAHREMPPVILTALGLYNDSNIKNRLPINQINHQRLWKSSKIIPFLGNIAVERLDCASVAHKGSFVRIIVNSTPKPLPGCNNGPGASCPLLQYINYVNQRNQLYKSFSKACQIDQNKIDSLTFYEKDDN